MLIKILLKALIWIHSAEKEEEQQGICRKFLEMLLFFGKEFTFFF